MFRAIPPAVFMMLTVALSAHAGLNPDAKLAMHVVASDEYLTWEDLIPAACESINVDVSVAELFAEGGYGYVVLLAYDVEGISAVEFALSGWPTGRGAPQLSAPDWYAEDALTFGDPLDDGGATGLGECSEPSTSGLVPLAYLTFGPLDSTDVPIDFSFLPSTFTAPVDSQLVFADCTEGFVSDEVVAHSGCTIGGTYAGDVLDCEETVGEGLPEDEFQWPVVVETGVLYVYGNRLEPPYVFSIKDSQLFVNGARLFPKLTREPPPPPREVPQRYRDMHALDEHAWEVGLGLLEKGTPRDSVARVIASVYRSSPLVNSVKVDGEEWILHWAGDPHPEYGSMPRDLPKPKPTFEEICANLMRHAQLFLRPGRAAFYGERYWVATGANDAEAALRVLGENGDPEAERLGVLSGDPARDLLDPVPLTRE